MDNERRNETRFEKKLLVNISKDDGYESMGLTANISRQGLFIAIPDLLPLNSEVTVLIGIANETLAIKGTVIWSQNSSNGASHEVQAAIGVKITEAPEQYFKFVDTVTAESN